MLGFSEFDQSEATVLATAPLSKPLLLALAAKIVSAHVTRTRTEVAGLCRLIEEIYRVLSLLESYGIATSAPPPSLPVVAGRRSVFPDYLICLEDGKKFKMLTRHLKAAYDLTPEQYRRKWGLPPDYPMVAPSHAPGRGSDKVRPRR